MATEHDEQHVRNWQQQYVAFHLAMQAFPEDVAREVLGVVSARNAPYCRMDTSDFAVAVWMDMLKGIEPAHLALEGARMAVESEAIEGAVAFCHVYQAAKLLGGG